MPLGLLLCAGSPSSLHPPFTRRRLEKSASRNRVFPPVLKTRARLLPIFQLPLDAVTGKRGIRSVVFLILRSYIMLHVGLHSTAVNRSKIEVDQSIGYFYYFNL